MLSSRIRSRFFNFRFYSGREIQKYSTISENIEENKPDIDNEQLQHQLNTEVINSLNALSIEESNKEDDIEPITCIQQGIINEIKYSGYTSLTKFNDSVSSVPQLSHNLSSTLFSPGVHYMTDPRTNHSNFDEFLTDIPHIDNLKMDKISNFTPSSRDNKLLDIVNAINKKNSKKFPNKKSLTVKFFSSTSSMTSVLVKFHKYLSHNRPINTTSFSKIYPDTTQFTRTSDVPTSLVITPKDENNEIYSIDADRSTDSEITLSILGNALELMLTKNPEEFSKYLKSSKETPDTDKSAYHYARMGKFVIRSQLDAVDKRLPGTGTFDIKTRAVCAIRFDLTHTDYFPTNYEINKTVGLFESFERELFDAARIVMFKYSLQARLGNMDGIFMAFHNVKKFLGFQYLPLTEIDNLFFGDYMLSGKKYGNRLLDKKINEEDNLENINISNREKLQNIVNDFGNHHQTKREVLSSFMANNELKISMKLLETLLETIIQDTKGKPFRMIVKKSKINFSSSSESETAESEDIIEEKENKEKKIEEKENKERKFEDEESDYSIIVLVNTLEADQLKDLQMLSKEKIEESKFLIKEVQNGGKLSPSERIKFFSKYVTEFKNKFFKLNRVILKTSEANNGFFAYQLQADHYFDGEKSTQKYPIPSIKILDENTTSTWEMKYTINKINKNSDKKFLYSKFTKSMGLSSFRDSEGESNIDVYNTENGDIELDENATDLQNITRAYSVKALKRKELFKSN